MDNCLRFDPTAYTLESIDINGKNVVYKAYKHICYCEKPVDDDFQSLDLLAPVEVDGVSLDCSRAPIIFAIDVHGYTSCPNKGDHKSMPPMLGMLEGMGGPPFGDKPEGMDGPPFGGKPEGMTGPPFGDMPEDDEGPGEIDNGYVSRLAMTYGFVCVRPGCRGSDCQWPEGDPRSAEGKYYGKAPAAMVDLKAAVRYLRHNRELIPGNTDHILVHGGSAGGGLSCLLAASGDSSLYEPYLEAIGAAKESDQVFASASFSPVMNLDNGDGAYEFQWSHVPFADPFSRKSPELVDQEKASQLIQIYGEYLKQCNLKGHGNWGTLTLDNMAEYIMEEYLLDEAKQFMSGKTTSEQDAYLEKNPWMHRDGDSYRFTFADFSTHAKRVKALPAFDEVPLRNAETTVFGNATENARHFTEFGLQNCGMMGPVDSELKAICEMFNPMWHVLHNTPGCATHWWIRHGGIDPAVSVPTVLNFATALENKNKQVNARIIWDGNHCADDDPEGLIEWFCKICNYQTAWR